MLQIDGEVNILRGEREQAKDIIEDLSKKLNAVNAVIDGYQEERQVTRRRITHSDVAPVNAPVRNQPTPAGFDGTFSWPPNRQEYRLVLVLRHAI